MAKNNNKVKNPLLDIVDEDISRMPIPLSFFEKIGLASALIISTFIFILSGLSLFIDIFIRLNLLYILIDILIMIFCLSAVYFIFNILRKKIVTEALVDTAFQHGVYARLQSLVENIAQEQVGTDVMIDRMSDLDMKVESILKERKSETGVGRVGIGIMEESVTLGTSVRFVIKAIFMIVLTMAIFMFLLNFALGGLTPYVSLLIFIVWWLFITNEYTLWKETNAWIMVFFPIIIIPVTVMILTNLLRYNEMLALLYVLLGLYTLLYYAWAIYATTGSIPFITPKLAESEEIESGEIKSGERNEFFVAQHKGMFQEIYDEIKYEFNKLKEKKK